MCYIEILNYFLIHFRHELVLSVKKINDICIATNINDELFLDFVSCKGIYLFMTCFSCFVLAVFDES